MTGEMHKADLADYPFHAAVAKLLGVPVEPFDTYIGPYLDCPEGMVFFMHDQDEEGPGVVLWPDGQGPAYRAPILEAAEDMDRELYALAVRRAQVEYWRQRGQA